MKVIQTSRIAAGLRQAQTKKAAPTGPPPNAQVGCGSGFPAAISKQIFQTEKIEKIGVCYVPNKNPT